VWGRVFGAKPCKWVKFNVQLPVAAAASSSSDAFRNCRGIHFIIPPCLGSATSCGIDTNIYKT